MSNVKSLSDSLTIRNKTIRNRFAVPPMVCFCWSDDDGKVTEKNIQHYRDLSLGGFGLIIVEAVAVSKRGRLHNTELGLWEDGQIEGMKKIADAIHEGGAVCVVQINHAGGNGTDPEPDAPSSTEYYFGKMGREMSAERIDEVIEEYVQAALRAQKAGFDGIELHGCHGYLASCFFNSRKNLRTDEYGQDKSLFARKILQAVRKACGDDFIVGIRLGAFEPTLDDAVEHARKVADYADFIDVAYGGDSDPFVPDGMNCSPAVYGASVIKKELPEKPVFGVHNINTKESAEYALSLGLDMVDIGRGCLVDPAFAKHILKGEEYGRCMNCKNYCRWNPPEMSKPDAKCPGFMAFQKKKDK